MQEKRVKNTEISKRLSQVIDFLGVKPQQFAKVLGYDRTQGIYDMLSGKAAPSFKFWEKFFNSEYSEIINPMWLLTGKGDAMVLDQQTQLLRAIPSSEGFPFLPFEGFGGIGDSNVSGVDLATIEERYIIPLFKGVKIDFMLSVNGSSMYPKYSTGDVVACRLVEELLFVQWNKVYVLDTHTQGVIIKRLKKSEKEDYVICKSDNKDYEEFEIPKRDIRNIALVVGVVRLE